jgi:transcription antitermination factor NusG
MFWAVVQAKPMCERRAIWHLERQHFTVYAPRERIKRIKRGKLISDARWLFPRYLFVWCEEQWQRWFNTFGVSTVLMHGQQPAALPNDFVDNMKSQENGGLITLYKPQRFHKGQRVQVISGLLNGRRGLYQGQTQQEREIVLLDALGRVELPPGLLR